MHLCTCITVIEEDCNLHKERKITRNIYWKYSE